MAANGWGGDPDVGISVWIGEDGPLDPPILTKAIFGGPGVFDVANWAGVNYVHGESGIQIVRGRTDEFDQFEAGTCTLVLNNNHREFDPANNDSPFQSICKPRSQIVVAVSRLSSPVASFTVLFAGVIDAWPQTWTQTTGTVEIVAHDLLSVMAQTTATLGSGVLILDSVYQGQLDQERLAGDLPQQLSGQRISALIGLAGLSSQFLALDTGLTEVVAFEPEGDVLALCQDATNAEAGFLFVDRNGVVTFLDRHSRFQDTRLGTVQVTFTDSQYSGMAVDYSITQMFNDARFTRPATDESSPPLEQTCFDLASIGEFGRRVHVEEIPVVSDGETLGRAEFWCNRYGTPQQRPSPVTIKARSNLTALFLPLARRELLDRIQLVRTPLGLGDPITFTGLVEQIEHRITTDDWECTLAISPIDVDEGQTFLVLDSGTLGQLNQETLAY